MAQKSISQPRGTSGSKSRVTANAPAKATAATTTSGGNILAECIETCNETLSYCLEQGGDHAERTHILSIIDCVDSCWYLSGLQARDSPLVGKAMEACAEATKACEESCEEFGDDETMKRCADVCRECYEHCSR